MRSLSCKNDRNRNWRRRSQGDGPNMTPTNGRSHQLVASAFPQLAGRGFHKNLFPFERVHRTWRLHVPHSFSRHVRKVDPRLPFHLKRVILLVATP